MISTTQAIYEYNLFKAKAISLANAGQYNSSMQFAETCARVAYHLNFRYTDNELEALLLTIGGAVLPQQQNGKSEIAYLFYDCFGYDNRGLTQQYIRALIAFGEPFVFVLANNGETAKSKNIIEELKACSFATLIVLHEPDYISASLALERIINTYKPVKAFLHLSPWDVSGICVWNRQTHIERYFIDLTDHAFWLGVNCADYFLEFRNYGYNLAIDHRRIAKEKLLWQPYYPIQSEEPFSGFPVDVTDKVVGFAGANFYKIYGRNNTFLKLMKQVLDRNPEFVLLFAGSGNQRPINKFIKEHQLENRIVLLGDRRDINAVYQHIDIYINTYPVIGALMTQFAVYNSRPIVSYSSPDLSFNFVEDLLQVDRDKAYSIKDEGAFIEELNKLIRDPQYREENVNRYAGSVPSVKQFNDNLRQNVSGNKLVALNYTPVQVNTKAITELYFEAENKFLKAYELMKFSLLKKEYIRHYFGRALVSAIKIVFFQPEMLIEKVKNKLK